MYNIGEREKMSLKPILYEVNERTRENAKVIIRKYPNIEEFEKNISSINKKLREERKGYEYLIYGSRIHLKNNSNSIEIGKIVNITLKGKLEESIEHEN